MATLLKLPREIRDEILGYALQADIPAPETPAASLDRTPVEYVMHLGEEAQYCISNRIPVFIERRQPAAPRPSGLGLLRASRQLRAEALPLLARHDANPELDVMFVKECGFWPTWTRAPLRPGRTRFDTVRVRFRVFDPPPGAPPDWRDDSTFFSPWAFDESPASSAFLLMLLGFAQQGPAFSGPVGTSNGGPFAAETLVLDVLPAGDPGAHRVMGPMADEGGEVVRDFFLEHRFRDLATWPARWPRPAELRADLVPSEKLAYFLWAWLHAALLSRFDADIDLHIYCSFGSIEVRVDGEARTVSHLSRWLALPEEVRLCPEDEEDDNLVENLKNVQRARERRAQRGIGQRDAARTKARYGDYDEDGADDYLEFAVGRRSCLNGTLEEGGIRKS